MYQCSYEDENNCEGEIHCIDEWPIYDIENEIDDYILIYACEKHKERAQGLETL